MDTCAGDEAAQGEGRGGDVYVVLCVFVAYVLCIYCVYLLCMCCVCVMMFFLGVWEEKTTNTCFVNHLTII